MKRDKYLLANLGHRYRHAHQRFSSVRRRPTPPAPQNGSKSTFARPVSPLCVCDTCPPRAEVYLVPYSRQFAVEGGVARQLEEVGRRKPKDKLVGNIIPDPVGFPPFTDGRLAREVRAHLVDISDGPASKLIPTAREDELLVHLLMGGPPPSLADRFAVSH